MTETDRHGRMLVRIVCAYAGLALAPAAPLVVLALVAETVAGRVAGLAGIALLAAPPALAVGAFSRVRPALRLACAVAPVGSLAVLVPILISLEPGGAPPAGSAVGSVFLGPGEYPRRALGSLVPEIDQVKVATWLLPLFDPALDLAGGARIRASVLPVYRGMERDPDFQELGSVLPLAYAELVGLSFDRGHLYTWRPTRRPAGGLDAVVFLHGSAGNFKVYLRAWKELAEARPAAIVCPTFGFGNWERPGGFGAVLRAREYAVSALGADPTRIDLVALSNGGRGALRAAIHAPKVFRSLVLVSAVVEDEILRSREIRDGWRGRRVLLLHGADDDRIPANVAREAAAALAKEGVEATCEIYPGEDHFLFLSSREKVLADIAAWLDRGESRK